VVSCNSCQFHISSRCRYHHKGTLPEVDLQSQEAAHLLNEHHSPSRFCSRLAQNDKIISVQQQQQTVYSFLQLLQGDPHAAENPRQRIPFPWQMVQPQGPTQQLHSNPEQ
jgi:hypothetical protein